MRRRTPCVDGWFGPKLTVIRSAPGGGSTLDGAPGGIFARLVERQDLSGRQAFDRAHTASVNCTGSPPIG